jgi:hypothetical protein
MENQEKIVQKFEQSQNSLVLQSSDLSLETIAAMVENGAIDPSPRYQRRERWKHNAQAELIESFLLNVPVPPVYLAEDDFGTYSVIDGKQRITAIHKFLRGNLVLENLTGFPEINGLTFQDLPKPLQNALNIRPYLRVVTLLKQTNPELKYEVFTRLNTGGQPLLPQEIRNALYRGPLNDLLFDLTSSQFLKQQLKIKTGNESTFTEMFDVEMVLRFFTFNENWRDFSGDARRSMDDFMATHKKSSKATLTKLADKYSDALNRCEQIWGENAFKRYAKPAFRDQFMAAIYDAQMIAASSLEPKAFDKIIKNKQKVTKSTEELFLDARFEEAVRSSTNTPSRVRYRIEKVQDMLLKI